MQGFDAAKDDDGDSSLDFLPRHSHLSAPPTSVHLAGAYLFTRVEIHPFTAPEFIRSVEQIEIFA